MVVSYSNLRNFDPPARYLYEKEHKTQTKEMITGSAVHKLILEPEDFEKEFTIVDCSTRNTNIYKDAAAENLKLPRPKNLLLSSEYDDVAAMAESVRDSYAYRYLVDGQAEKMLYWQYAINFPSSTPRCSFCEKLECDCGEPNVIMCRMKLDYVSPLGIAEIKTASSIHEKTFFWDAMKRLYHMQASFYLQGLEAPFTVEGNPKVFTPSDLLPFAFPFEVAPDFRWIVVESSAPYLVRVFVPDLAMLDLGRSLWQGRLERFKECFDTGEYPGYTTDTFLQTRV